ncbi:protein kinase domain-containing protein [Yinghuangia aomiensis]
MGVVPQRLRVLHAARVRGVHVKLGDVIAGYRVTTAPTNANGGKCIWAFAEKSGSSYFIKQFLEPKRPKDDARDSPSLRIRRQLAEEFEERHRTIMKRLRPDALGGGNLVLATDFFHEGSTYYKVTERIDTSSLEKPQALEPRQKMVLLKTLATSLKQLHDIGIVHGDLKPLNVLVQKRDAAAFHTAKLIDFDDSYLTGKPPAPEDISGDSLFGAPEWRRYVQQDGSVGPDHLTCAVDVFALGLMTHLYLTGELPNYEEGFGSPADAVNAGRKLRFDPRLSDDVLGLLRGTTQADPKQRPRMSTYLKILSDPEVCALQHRRPGTSAPAARRADSGTPPPRTSRVRANFARPDEPAPAPRPTPAVPLRRVHPRGTRHRPPQPRALPGPPVSASTWATASATHHEPGVAMNLANGQYQGNLQYAVDIVLCIDATGSMYPVLDNVKASALQFHDRLDSVMAKKGKSISQLRLKTIAFRDFGDDPATAIEQTDFLRLPDQAKESRAVRQRHRGGRRRRHPRVRPRSARPRHQLPLGKGTGPSAPRHRHVHGRARPPARHGGGDGAVLPRRHPAHHRRPLRAVGIRPQPDRRDGAVGQAPRALRSGPRAVERPDLRRLGPHPALRIQGRRGPRGVRDGRNHRDDREQSVTGQLAWPGFRLAYQEGKLELTWTGDGVVEFQAKQCVQAFLNPESDDGSAQLVLQFRCRPHDAALIAVRLDVPGNRVQDVEQLLNRLRREYGVPRRQTEEGSDFARIPETAEWTLAPVGAASAELFDAITDRIAHEVD